LSATRHARRLLAEFAGYGRTLVAFSGGVDSGVVLAAAVRAKGSAGAAALTAVSPAVPAADVAAAGEFCATLNIPHYTVRTGEMAVDGYRDNGPTRCYFCKTVLLDAAMRVAVARGFETVATGTNRSDLAAGFRPGIKAAAQRGARTPLADVGLDKRAVRELAQHWRLSIWDKPATACLSSRIAFGVAITPERLARVERAEAAVRRILASRQVCDLRVRDLGEAVRLEVDAGLVDAARDDPAVRLALDDAGFGGTPLTVEAFRSGAMNELLVDMERWRHA
jgi:pyridinium-3,5-biscarboxylic acid mononucleotide sulfurtransferase